MRRWWALFFLLAMVTACPGQTAVRQGSLANAPCITYHEGMDWNQVAAEFGTPDLLPRPEPGTALSQNARGYRVMTVIFYTKRQQYNEAGKIRFKEVIYKVDICKPQ